MLRPDPFFYSIFIFKSIASVVRHPGIKEKGAGRGFMSSIIDAVREGVTFLPPPELPVQASILQGLGDMAGFNILFSL